MAAEGRIRAVSDATFDDEVVASELPVLVDFTAAWCGPCKALAPTLAKLADEFAGEVKVVSVDVDENPATAARFGVKAMPTLVVFAEGDEVARHVGLADRRRLLDLLLAATDLARASRSRRVTSTWPAK